MTEQAIPMARVDTPLNPTGTPVDKGTLAWLIIPDLIGVTDASGIFMKTNPAWFTTLGLMPEEIESRLFFDFVHPEDLGKTAKVFADIQQGQPIFQFENCYRHKDGSHRWLSWNAVPEGDLYFCNARDITAAKASESALIDSAAEAVLPEQFISILGHDLRNALAGALCAVQFLQREPLTDRGQMMMVADDASLQRMSRLIDDVLDFARARLGGEIGIRPKPEAALKSVLRKTVQEIWLAHPDVHLDEVDDFTDPITCDPDRIAQLISNLPGNAVFHGDPGGGVRIRAHEDDTDLRISITNFGEQIKAETRAMLFEPFNRAEPGSSQNGLGLGLFISKQIADSHNGDIEVHSDGMETTFTLPLPQTCNLRPVIATPEPEAIRRSA